MCIDVIKERHVVCRQEVISCGQGITQAKEVNPMQELIRVAKQPKHNSLQMLLIVHIVTLHFLVHSAVVDILERTTQSLISFQLLVNLQL